MAIVYEGVAANNRIDIEITVAEKNEAIRHGMSMLVEQWKRLNTRAAMLVCTLKADLRGSIGQALGPIAEILYNNGTAICKDVLDRELRFVYEATLPHAGEGMPILAILPTRQVLTSLDALPNIGALIVVPFNDQDTEDWRNARQPQIVGPTPSTAPAPAFDATLVRALDSLLTTLDKNRPGLDHDSDRALVIGTFRALKEARISYDPTAVRSYLASHGMNPKQADAIRDISEDPSRRRAKAKIPGSKQLLKNWSI